MGNSTSYNDNGSSVDPPPLPGRQQGQKKDNPENGDDYNDERKNRSCLPTIPEKNEENSIVYVGENVKVNKIEDNNNDGGNQASIITEYTIEDKREENMRQNDNDVISSEDEARESIEDKNSNEAYSESQFGQQSRVPNEDEIEGKMHVAPIEKRKNEVINARDTSLSLGETTHVPFAEQAIAKTLVVNVNQEEIKIDSTSSISDVSTREQDHEHGNRDMHTGTVDYRSTRSVNIHVDDKTTAQILELHPDPVAKQNIPKLNIISSKPNKRNGIETKIKSAETSNVNMIVSSKKAVSSKVIPSDGMNQYLEEYHRKIRKTDTLEPSEKHYIMNEMMKETSEIRETEIFVDRKCTSTSNNKTTYAAGRKKRSDKVKASLVEGQINTEPMSPEVTPSVLDEKMCQGRHHETDDQKLSEDCICKENYQNDLATGFTISEQPELKNLSKLETPIYVNKLTSQDGDKHLHVRQQDTVHSLSQ